MLYRAAIVIIAFAALLGESAALNVGGAKTSRRQLLSGAVAAAALPVAAANADTAISPTKVGVTPSGVKYFTKDETSTCSPFNPCTPQAGDIVKIKYKSYLSNGQMYDSSEGPGRKPLAAKFKGGQILPAWEEALEDMKMGQTRIIQVPPELAYGSKGLKVETKAGEEFLVPPNERLQFELTLVQVALPPP